MRVGVRPAAERLADDLSGDDAKGDAIATEAQRKGHLNRLELQYRADYDYYAGEGEITYNGRKTQALNLPRAVLEKFYHENAERIFKLREAWTAKLPAE